MRENSVADKLCRFPQSLQLHPLTPPAHLTGVEPGGRGAPPAARSPAGGSPAGGGRRDIQDKYISTLKEQNRIMQQEIGYLKDSAAAARAAPPQDEPRQARFAPPPIPGIGGGSMGAPASSSGTVNVSTQSIEVMLAQIKAKAEAEQEKLRVAHAQTDEDLENYKDLLAEEQRVTEQLRADKQALHSTYLSRVEEEQTKRQ